MIDKSLRKATAQRYGDVIVIRMTGGGDCLWLNMYLDEVIGQMTCDSDIGSYAYHWGPEHNFDWTDFWCKWLSNEEWLLRKCCGERRTERVFDCEGSVNDLRTEFARTNNDDKRDEFEEVLEIAKGYDNAETFAAALNVAADDRWIDLPDEWWMFISEDYTPWQKRFAEICREVIVPAIRAMERSEKENEQT